MASGHNVASNSPRAVRAHKHGIARRESILDSALRVFSEHGYRATTISMVARDAGLTDAGVLHHFQSKPELFEEVLKQRKAPFLDAFSPAPRNLEEFVAAYQRAVELSLEHPDLARFYAVISGDMQFHGHPFHEHYRQEHQDSLRQLSQFLQHLKDEGELESTVESRRLAGDIIALQRGMRSEWLLTLEEDENGKPQHPLDFPTAFASALRALLSR